MQTEILLIVTTKPYVKRLHGSQNNASSGTAAHPFVTNVSCDLGWT
ncbi:MAG: hypothetical protein QOI12_3182 [Alphaproteobacteria bacterium]|jgi:hypothetical protein|nr:hypothetical protein [Alphaproteobacteria bacterium]